MPVAGGGFEQCYNAQAAVTGSLPGLIVLVTGSLSALIGILYATTQAGASWRTARSRTWASSRPGSARR